MVKLILLRNFTMMKKSLFILIVLFFSTNYVECQESILSDFSVNKSGNKILLDWTIKAGSTCNGIDVYRSDGVSDFIKIGDIVGVCGNVGYPSSYTFTDNDPLKNQFNFYRLNLGGSQTSEILSIEYIEVGENNYFLKNNIDRVSAILYFTNKNELNTTIQLYDLSGKFIKTIQTNSDFIEISYSDYPKGMLFFKIGIAESLDVIFGKMMVF